MQSFTRANTYEEKMWNEPGEAGRAMKRRKRRKESWVQASWVAVQYKASSARLLGSPRTKVTHQRRLG